MPFRALNHASCKTYLADPEGDHAAALIDPMPDHLDRYIAMLAYFGCGLEMTIDTQTPAGGARERPRYSRVPASTTFST